MPRMRSKLTQRHPLSDQEMRDLIVSYLKHGFGHEVFFREFLDAAAELTPKRLAREWPQFRDEIMAGHDSPYSRPHGWWCAECPEPQRSVYLRAYKVDAAHRRAIHTPLPLHGRPAQSSDCTGPPEHEDLGDVEERLLIELGLLEDEDHDDGNEGSDTTTNDEALSCMQTGDAGLVGLAPIPGVPNVYDGDAGDPTNDNDGASH